jgi:hypothetical protein
MACAFPRWSEGVPREPRPALIHASICNVTFSKIASYASIDAQPGTRGTAPQFLPAITIWRLNRVTAV